jgi:two-component system sensor histidine kinase KdpD
VALTGAPGTETLVRRAARIAQRAHGELVGVHVRSDDGLAGPSDVLESQRRLLVELGGTHHEVAGNDIAAALVDFARAENATQLVLGASRRSRRAELLRGSVINRVVKLSGPIDVHVISHQPTAPAAGEPLGAPPPPRRHSSLAPRRRLLGWCLAAAGLPLVTLSLANLRDHLDLPGVLLIYLLLVVATAALGGWAPAVAAAVAGFLCTNYFFTPPIHTWTIAEAENLLALLVFLIVGVTVSTLVAAAARRAAEATRASAEAETLAGLAGSMAEPDPLPHLLDNLRRAFGLAGASLLRRGSDDGGWVVVAASGERAPRTPDAADDTRPLGPDLVLALSGSHLAAEDRRVLNAFAVQLGAAVERRRLHAQAAQAAALAEADELRTALLQAVSHDLRTPLAGIKASASSLRQPDVTWSDDDVRQFLATIEEETDRLTDLVANLLDMSRIQAGAVTPVQREVDLDEVVPAAIAGLGERGRGVVVDVPESLPPVRTDAAMLERVVANLVDNALGHGRPVARDGGGTGADRADGVGPGVRVEAGEVGGHVLVRVIDRGQGIPEAQRETVFEPFQRLDDAGHGGHGTGVGLGLAVARGFTRAMGGELTIEDTPGGGTTMVIELEAVR